MQVTSPKCPNCGANILDPNAKFCAHCGSAIVVSNASQSLPTAASLLELGKSLLAAGNFREADKQFILALQFEPNNKEAWLCRGVCANPYEISTYWSKSGFTRDQIVNYFASFVNGKALLRQYYLKYIYNYPHISGFENQATICLDAVLRAQHEPPSRKDLLAECEMIVSSGLATALRSQSKSKNMILEYCIGLGLLLDCLGPDQPGDLISSNMPSGEDFFGGSYSRKISEKPSYWRKYIQQVEAKYQRKP